MSIIGIDTELICGVIKREIDVFQIGSPLNVFMTTFEVCQRLQRDPVPGEVRYHVGEEHGPLARSLDNVRQRRNWVRPLARIQLFCFPRHLSTVTSVATVMPQSRLSISRRNRASRSGSLTTCRQTGKQREILVGSDLKSVLHASTRTRKTFL